MAKVKEQAKCHRVPMDRMTQPQLDILVGVTNQMLANGWSTPRFEREVDKAFEAAGCPITEDQQVAK